MTATIINFAEARVQLQIAEVLRQTQDAYSRPAYGELEWAKCAALILELGHGVDVAAALLASRLTRWAREDAADYDAPTASDLATFLRSTAGLNALSYELAA
jgi:hypothetical protein